MSELERIRFTETRVVQDEHKGTEDETRFVEGEVHELPADSAKHWLDRGCAVRDAADSGEAGTIDVSQYHKGGGYYELPSGERVKGKDAAIAALQGQAEE